MDVDSITKTTVVNFAFALTAVQRGELAIQLGVEESTIIFNESRPGFFKPEEMPEEALPKWQRYINSLLEAAKVPREGRVIVNLPGMSWAAVATLSAISGWIGHMPEVMRLVADDSNLFHVQEVVNFQRLRDETRQNRYNEGGTDHLLDRCEKVLINFSHPITPEQMVAIEAAEGKIQIISVKTQVDPKESFVDQAFALVNSAGLSTILWQQPKKILVNAPAMGPLAAAVYAELNARMGQFPQTVRLNQKDKSFEFAEVLDLQQFRQDWIEKSIEAGRQPVEAEFEMGDVTMSELKRLLDWLGVKAEVEPVNTGGRVKVTVKR